MPEDVRLLILAGLLVLAEAAGAQRLPSGVASYDTGLSAAAQAVVARAKQGLAAVPTGRKLLAETADVPLREAQTGIPVSYRRNPPALLLDSQAIAAAGERDFSLDLVRELRRAELALPVPVPEEEQACRQDELRFALEKAAAEPAFDHALRKPAPESERESVAREISVFAGSPDRFYRQVESGLSPDVRLSSLALVADFLKAHPGPIAAPGDDYAVVDGERFPAALALAAARLGRDNGLARAREALTGFDEAPARELSRAARQWLGR